jgi:hypothetical protein
VRNGHGRELPFSDVVAEEQSLVRRSGEALGDVAHQAAFESSERLLPTA